MPYTPSPLVWAIEPNDALPLPLRLAASRGGATHRIGVSDLELEALFSLLADHLLKRRSDYRQGGPSASRVPAVLEDMRATAAYEIGDPSWADLLIEVAADPDGREAREEERA